MPLWRLRLSASVIWIWPALKTCHPRALNFERCMPCSDRYRVHWTWTPSCSCLLCCTCIGSGEYESPIPLGAGSMLPSVLLLFSHFVLPAHTVTHNETTSQPIGLDWFSNGKYQIRCMCSSIICLHDC
jgi:hypothetical protein